jgi:hypothetical protein
MWRNLNPQDISKSKSPSMAKSPIQDTNSRKKAQKPWLNIGKISILFGDLASHNKMPLLPEI